MLSACGSQFKASTGIAGASSGGDGSVGGGDGSSAGEASGGDTTGGASAAGTGGKSANGCDCPAGSYCQDGTTSCLPCDSFSRLQFAAPQKLATISQTGSQRFPRAASKAGLDLFYRVGAADAEQVWYAATPLSGAGRALASAGVLTSAPLLAPGVLQQNFFFDQQSDDGSTDRHIMLGNWSGTVLSGVVAAPAPFNGSGSDFSIAVAAVTASVARAYWMSTRNDPPKAELLWAEMLGGTPTVPAVLDLKVQAGNATCARSGDDATPWVTPAGTLLLFSNVSVDDSCAPNDSGGVDLYAVPLSKETGLPTTAAVPLASLNIIGGGSNESDPSLSNDLCTLYFASDNGTADSDLYKAQRN